MRPSARLGLRIGAIADLGTASDVDRVGFSGAWTDWSLAGIASWTFAPNARWELEPYAGAGFARSSLAGTLMNTPYEQAATLALACGGMWVRRRFAMWTLGAGASLEGRPGPPTYTRSNGNNQTIFQVPSFGVEVGVLAAADFGR
ncbi:MAG: hypothetical protein KIT31_33440 [Deltaproteobacteria bacterium]|nr:hypothetical protein [Deltaproteobacteria bacterium]